MFGDIFPLPLGEGRISMRVFTSIRNTGEGVIGEVYNALEEVKRGVGQEVAVFRHAEFISASNDIPSPVLRTPSPRGRGDMTPSFCKGGDKISCHYERT